MLCSQKGKGELKFTRGSPYLPVNYDSYHNFPVSNDWGSHYLLVNYDMESLFRRVKILRDSGKVKSRQPFRGWTLKSKQSDELSWFFFACWQKFRIAKSYLIIVGWVWSNMRMQCLDYGTLNLLYLKIELIIWADFVHTIVM